MLWVVCVVWLLVLVSLMSLFWVGCWIVSWVWVSWIILFVRLFVDWDVCSPRIRFYSDGVLVDDFPVDCCFDDGLWSDFRESVCGVSDLLGVLAVLECGECTRVGGLSIGCVG